MNAKNEKEDYLQDRYLFLDFSADSKCYWLLKPQCGCIQVRLGTFFLCNSTDKSVNAPECCRASFAFCLPT